MVVVSLCPTPSETLFDNAHQNKVDFEELWAYAGLDLPRLELGSLEKAYIDPEAGSLELSLTHLFVFKSVPKVTRLGEKHYRYEIAPSNEGVDREFLSLALILKHSIDIQPSRDRLFCLTTHGEDDLGGPWQDGTVYLILRQEQTERGMPTYSLLSTSVSFCASGRRDDGVPLFSPRLGYEPDIDAPKTRDLGKLDMYTVRTSMAFTMKWITHKFLLMTDHFPSGKHLLLLPRGKKDWLEVGRLCRALWQDREDDENASRLRDVLKATLTDSDTSATLSLRRINKSNTLSKRRVKSILKKVRDYMEKNGLFLLLESIQQAYTPPPQPQNLFEMLEQGPTEEQRYIGTIKYVGGARMDGSIRRVRII